MLTNRFKWLFGTKEYLGYNNFEGQFDSTNINDYYGSIPVLGYIHNFLEPMLEIHLVMLEV